METKLKSVNIPTSIGKNDKVCIIGLGYVGFPLAYAFARTRHVIGFDISEERIRNLRAGIDTVSGFSEDQLDDCELLTLTCDPSSLSDAKVYIVTVPTPVDRSNEPDFGALIEASRLIGNNLLDGDFVVFESTVFPGATEEICIKEIENVSSLERGKDFFFGYSPERINPGDKDMVLANISKVVSGNTIEVGKVLKELYSEVIRANIHIAPSIKVAEASKIVENIQRDVNIALINECAKVFSSLGIDTIDVIEAASTKWNFAVYTPGLVGGHCIGVDPYYFIAKARLAGCDTPLISLARCINEEMVVHSLERLKSQLASVNKKLEESCVGVFGLTFKEDCADLRNSKSLELAQTIHAEAQSTILVDGHVKSQMINDKKLPKLTSIKDVSDLDALVLASPHTEFLSLEKSDFLRFFKKNEIPVIFDVRNKLKTSLDDCSGLQIFCL